MLACFFPSGEEEFLLSGFYTDAEKQSQLKGVFFYRANLGQRDGQQADARI